MALTPGTRLGSYEIAAQIGVGGMGEVYRATDTKLKRQVAVKVLPATLAGDPERLARLQREAEVLASLNHPGIAHIYGLEDADGSKALVMELVEGPTLADRIAQGAIPVDEALPITRQIAEALEAAHEQGIIHRDLKPANIKLRDDGTVKVLDFGLAKAMEPAGPASASATMSPTITTPAMTQAGLILGTAAYMSPEQAKGHPADRRSDIWAFGAVLYEMLTGQRAFAGEDLSDTMASVLKADTDWHALPASVPPRVVVVIKGCLQRNPRQRIHDVADVRLALDGAFETASSQTGAPAVPGRRLWHVALPWGIAILALVGGTLVSGTVWLQSRASPTEAPAVSRLIVEPAPEAPLAHEAGFDLAISRDGRRIVYIAVDRATQVQSLWVRDLDALTSRHLGGTDLPAGVGNVNPFFSADGQSVFYHHPQTGLMRVEVRGGVPVQIAPDPGQLFAGGAPGANDTVIFADGAALYRVSASGGGTPERVSPPDSSRAIYASPSLLPGGGAVLFNMLGGEAAEAERVAVLDLARGTVKVLLNGAVPAYAASGHLLFVQGTTLMAAPFDLTSLAVTGSAVPVLDGVRHPALVSAGDYGVAGNGTLVYAPSAETVGGPRSRLVWVDRAGRVVGSVSAAALAAPRQLRLSPDGRQVAVMVGPPTRGELWVYNTTGNPPLRLVQGGVIAWPVWSADSRRVAFENDILSAKIGELATLPSDGSQLTAEHFTEGATSTSVEHPNNWLPNGDLLISYVSSGSVDIFLAHPGDTNGQGWTPLVHTPFDEWGARVSPDGRWLAYSSTRTGSTEIWVQALPAGGPPVRVSENGGAEPVWSRTGRELFYLAGDTLMAASVEAGSGFRVAARTELFTDVYTHERSIPGGPISGTEPSYDVGPDGRFLMIQPVAGTAGEAASTPIVVVQNWTQELQRLVPSR